MCQTNLRWLTSLRNMVESTRPNTTRRQRRHKRDFNAPVLLALLPAPSDHVYIGEDPSLKGNHYLSLRADGLYLVIPNPIDGQTVHVCRVDHDESVNTNRIEIAPSVAIPLKNHILIRGFSSNGARCRRIQTRYRVSTLGQRFAK